jgi:hypothetical protein
MSDSEMGSCVILVYKILSSLLETYRSYYIISRRAPCVQWRHLEKGSNGGLLRALQLTSGFHKGGEFVHVLKMSVSQEGLLHGMLPWWLLLSMPMGWDYVSELQPLTGLLFIPQVIHESGERRWNNVDKTSDSSTRTLWQSYQKSHLLAN